MASVLSGFVSGPKFILSSAQVRGSWIEMVKGVAYVVGWRTNIDTSDRILFGNDINPLKPELIPIYYLLALLGAHHFLHVNRIRVKLLTFRLLMSYIYMTLVA